MLLHTAGFQDDNHEDALVKAALKHNIRVVMIQLLSPLQWVHLVCLSLYPVPWRQRESIHCTCFKTSQSQFVSMMPSSFWMKLGECIYIYIYNNLANATRKWECAWRSTATVHSCVPWWWGPTSHGWQCRRSALALKNLDLKIQECLDLWVLLSNVKRSLFVKTSRLNAMLNITQWGWRWDTCARCVGQSWLYIRRW